MLCELYRIHLKSKITFLKYETIALKLKIMLPKLIYMLLKYESIKAYQA